MLSITADTNKANTLAPIIFPNAPLANPPGVHVTLAEDPKPKNYKPDNDLSDDESNDTQLKADGAASGGAMADDVAAKKNEAIKTTQAAWANLMKVIFVTTCLDVETNKEETSPMNFTAIKKSIRDDQYLDLMLPVMQSNGGRNTQRGATAKWVNGGSQGLAASLKMMVQKSSNVRIVSATDKKGNTLVIARVIGFNDFAELCKSDFFVQLAEAAKQIKEQTGVDVTVPTVDSILGGMDSFRILKEWDAEAQKQRKAAAKKTDADDVDDAEEVQQEVKGSMSYNHFGVLADQVAMMANAIMKEDVDLGMLVKDMKECETLGDIIMSHVHLMQAARANRRAAKKAAKNAGKPSKPSKKASKGKGKGGSNKKDTSNMSPDELKKYLANQAKNAKTAKTRAENEARAKLLVLVQARVAVLEARLRANNIEVTPSSSRMGSRQNSQGGSSQQVEAPVRVQATPFVDPADITKALEQVAKAQEQVENGAPEAAETADQAMVDAAKVIASMSRQASLAGSKSSRMGSRKSSKGSNEPPRGTVVRPDMDEINAARRAKAAQDAAAASSSSDSSESEDEKSEGDEEEEHTIEDLIKVYAGNGSKTDAEAMEEVSEDDEPLVKKAAPKKAAPKKAPKKATQPANKGKNPKRKAAPESDDSDDDKPLVAPKKGKASPKKVAKK